LSRTPKLWWEKGTTARFPVSHLKGSRKGVQAGVIDGGIARQPKAQRRKAREKSPRKLRSVSPKKHRFLDKGGREAAKNGLGRG